jgi:lipoprotein-anchoring transpeptidase ErfK/SrfK
MSRGWIVGIAIAAVAIIAVMAWALREPAPSAADPTPLDAAGLKDLKGLRSRAEALEKRLASLTPRAPGPSLVIDTGRNLLFMNENGKETLRAICSTGSGRALVDPDRKRRWVFDTPRGEFFIRAKHPNPVWIKPDWAFLEIGEPIPRGLAERLAPAELGAYAMDLGDGYLIHGTLYQRALGMSITHGCVRLGDKDLETVYQKVRIGTPVYIY